MVAALEVAGLKADRPMETGVIWSPQVAGVEGQCLIVNSANRVRKPPHSQLLIEFATLATADDAAIVRFAKEFGALGVGEDGWPLSPDKDVVIREPLAGWRALAIRLQAAINLGADFHNGKPGSKENWLAFTQGENRYELFHPWKEKAPYRTDMYLMIRVMIARFGVSPRFWWNEKRGHWQTDLDATGFSNLPGILVIQLMLLIADKKGWALCSECGDTYPVTRKPNPARRNYCHKPECYKDAAWRNAAADKRERERRKSK